MVAPNNDLTPLDERQATDPSHSAPEVTRTTWIDEELHAARDRGNMHQAPGNRTGCAPGTHGLKRPLVKAVIGCGAFPAPSSG